MACRLGIGKSAPDRITVGTEVSRGFINDNVYHSDTQGDIHFSSYIPVSFDGTEKYALFVTLPGWEGLYFQGVGTNMGEDFGTEAIKYNDKMIVISTQLSDWGETSAEQGLSEKEIDHLLTLDVKEQEYFSSAGYPDQHMGGMAFAHDEEIMGWLFSQH